jgi:type IV secretory pathway VirB4 component
VAEAYGNFKTDPSTRGEWAEEAAYALDFLEIILRGSRAALEPDERGALSEVMATLADDGWANKYEITLEHFAELLRSHRKFSKLSHGLSDFCEGGPWDGFFNKPTGNWHPKNLTVFDLDGIDGAQFKQLRSVLFPAIARFTMGTFNANKDRPKFFIVDEGKAFLDDPSSAKFVDFAFQRTRKVGGCCALIVQAPMYLTRSPFGESILANTDEHIFLSSKEIGKDDMTKMGLSEQEIEVVKTLETRPREYSVLYFRSRNFGKSRLVLRLPPQEYWLATTDPEDHVRFAEAFKAEGGDLVRTIARLSGAR